MVCYILAMVVVLALVPIKKIKEGVRFPIFFLVGQIGDCDPIFWWTRTAKTSHLGTTFITINSNTFNCLELGLLWLKVFNFLSLTQALI